MEHVTQIEAFLMLDCHKKVPLRTIELRTDTLFITDIDPEELRFYNHIALHIQTNKEETEP